MLECEMRVLLRSSSISDIPHCITLRYGQFQSHTSILNATDVHREQLISILKQAGISHFNLSNIIIGMKKRINPEIYQSSNMHNMWPVDEYIIAVCSRGGSTE